LYEKVDCKLLVKLTACDKNRDPCLKEVMSQNKEEHANGSFLQVVLLSTTTTTTATATATTTRRRRNKS
jgi:hypothetical protein